MTSKGGHLNTQLSQVWNFSRDRQPSRNKQYRSAVALSSLLHLETQCWLQFIPTGRLTNTFTDYRISRPDRNMSKWSKLQLPSDSPAPPLLYKYLTSKLGCEIYVTDLAHVWSQSLSRKDILKNASKYNTSIDPGEDEEQYFVFLQKISDALRGSEGNSLLLTSDPGGEKLKLLTSTKLPTPLVPLEWTFTLSQQPPNALAKHILLPILKGEANHEARILSLIGHVKQKDWTLNKLFDKIESSGVDLSMVFHGMGGVRLSRKESVYSQASQLIKGVAPFDENLWNNEYQAKDADYNLGVHIANELSFTSSFADRQIDDFAPDNWWNKLGTDSFGNARQTARKDKDQKKPVSEISPPPAEKGEASHSDDDEFQVRYNFPNYFPNASY